MKSDQKAIDRSLARYSNPSTEQVESAVASVWGDLASEVRETPDASLFHVAEDRPRWRSRWTVLIAATAVLIVGTISTAIVRNVTRFSGPTGSVETVDGKLYRVSGQKAYAIAAGERIATGETVRSDGGAVLALADKSRVEMRSGAEFTLESASDGARIRLNHGSIIVTAEEQRSGHLYVQTKDVTVSVVGTVFLVNVEEEGSRVVVVQGEVRVLQAGIEKTLLPGEQVATTPALELRSLSEEVSWSRNAQEHIALLARMEPIPSLPAFQDAAPQNATPSGASKFDAASVKVESQPPGGTSVGEVQGLSCTGSDGVWRATMSARITSFDAPRGRCVGRYIGIQMLVSALYDVHYGRVTGSIPNWRVPGSPYEFGFRIEATAADLSGVTVAQLRQMLKALIIERFNLKVHPDMREADGYALTVAPGNVKLQLVSNSEESFPSLEESPRQQVIKGKTSMRKFVDFLRDKGSRCNLVDQTSLFDVYDYTLTLHVVPSGGNLEPIKLNGAEVAEREKKKSVAAAAGVSAIAGPESCAPLRGRNAAGAAIMFEYVPSFATSLQQQMGLRLERRRVLSEYVVIDEVSKPTEN